MSGTRRLTGRIQVALPPGEAFRLFTPRGEQDWAHGWHPRFPAPAPDDTEPGTVFETSAHGLPTIWLVTGREPGKRISYARVTPGDQAGTVTVTISPAGQLSEVEVTYELTALTSLADHKLAEFADGYPAYLHSWQDAIDAMLRDAGSQPGAQESAVLQTNLGTVDDLAGRWRGQLDGRDRPGDVVGRLCRAGEAADVLLNDLRLARVGHVCNVAVGIHDQQHPDAVEHGDLALD